MTGVAALVVASSAFTAGSPVPLAYTGLGRNVSPPLSWSGVPGGTVSFALICDDPDAPMGTWIHWVLFNLPSDTRLLQESIPARPKLPNGAVQGINDFRRTGYGGPMPPPGKAHRYRFTVYALDIVLSLDSGARKADVERAMEGHILARGELMGTFQR